MKTDRGHKQESTASYSHFFVRSKNSLSPPHPLSPSYITIYDKITT
nr:MAG TPA: hypothetical protein [Caudoviricetes sp.]